MLVILLLMAGVGIEQADTPVLTFHVQNTDFQPVTVADWVEEGVLKAFITGLDTDLGLELIDNAATMGVTIVHGPGPETYYPLKKDASEDVLPSGQNQQYLTAVRQAKKHGMRYIMGISPYPPVELAKLHPEWLLQHTPDEDPIMRSQNIDLELPENAYLRQMSLNSPYGDYLIDCLIEIMNTYEVDGFSFDGNYHPFIDYSTLQQEMYTSETGYPFPERPDMNDIHYRLYLVWAGDKLEAWYRKLHDRLRAVNPEAAVYTWTTNAGRYGHFLTVPRVMSSRMNQLFDAPVQEWWMDEVNLGATVVPAFGSAYARAITGDRVAASEPYLMTRGNPYSTDSFPAHELLTRCMLGITHGVFVPLNIHDPGDTGSQSRAIHAMALRKEWLIRTKSMPWAAMLVSEQTRLFYGYRGILDTFLAHPLGVFRAAMEAHLAVTLINDWDIKPEVLAKYKVLILPNSACLSLEQVDIIRRYVQDGGGLIATCDTSLFDEIGRPRQDFALADVFGASWEGRPDNTTPDGTLDANFMQVVDETYWAQRTGISAFRWGASDILTQELVTNDLLKALVPGAQATFKGPMVRVKELGINTERAMIMFPGISTWTLPAALMGTYGEGRVIYWAAGIDAGYFNYGYPYQRALLQQSIEWAAQSLFPIQVEAPMCVQVAYYQQEHEGNTRIIVHLFNNINTTGGHGLSAVETPLREETVPITGIRIRIEGLPVARCSFEPYGTELQLQSEEEAVIIDLPPLEVHAMVVIEL